MVINGWSCMYVGYRVQLEDPSNAEEKEIRSRVTKAGESVSTD
jgi:hypothetical protein